MTTLTHIAAYLYAPAQQYTGQRLAKVFSYLLTDYQKNTIAEAQQRELKSE